MASEEINGDLSVRATADTARMAWQPSPSGTVWRKRVHLVGPPEAGQVTSLVRYQGDSTFPEHGHPDGEEILVLDGVFSDHQGDWPAGTYLLNPEGFRHAPFSKPGCLLFVKLRQYPGRERAQVALNTDAMAWERVAAGVSSKILYRQSGFADETRLERWVAGTGRGWIEYPSGAELFVIEGGYADENGAYGEGFWQRFPAGTGHRPETEDGCCVYVKEGGFAYLSSG